MSIKAYRSGETASAWSPDPFDESYRLINGRLAFTFKMPAAGGGTTEVELRLTPESFEEVARAMMTLDEDAAVRAFGAALQAKRRISN